MTKRPKVPEDYQTVKQASEVVFSPFCSKLLPNCRLMLHFFSRAPDPVAIATKQPVLVHIRPWGYKVMRES